MDKTPRSAPRNPDAPDYAAKPGGKHAPEGWPHLSSTTGACMCTNRCCQGSSGCICRECSGFGHVNCEAGGWGV